MVLPEGILIVPISRESCWVAGPSDWLRLYNILGLLIDNRWTSALLVALDMELRDRVFLSVVGFFVVATNLIVFGWVGARDS